ncbi:MAG: hypothetical protein ACRDIY_15880, partial [Chloroflexota bacterium]
SGGSRGAPEAAWQSLVVGVFLVACVGIGLFVVARGRAATEFSVPRLWRVTGPTPRDNRSSIDRRVERL